MMHAVEIQYGTYRKSNDEFFSFLEAIAYFRVASTQFKRSANDGADGNVTAIVLKRDGKSLFKTKLQSTRLQGDDDDR